MRYTIERIEDHRVSKQACGSWRLLEYPHLKSQLATITPVRCNRTAGHGGVHTELSDRGVAWGDPVVTSVLCWADEPLSEVYRGVPWADGSPRRSLSAGWRRARDVAEERP